MPGCGGRKPSPACERLQLSSLCATGKNPSTTGPSARPEVIHSRPHAGRPTLWGSSSLNRTGLQCLIVPRAACSCGYRPAPPGASAAGTVWGGLPAPESQAPQRRGARPAATLEPPWGGLLGPPQRGPPCCAPKARPIVACLECRGVGGIDVMDLAEPRRGDGCLSVTAPGTVQRRDTSGLSATTRQGPATPRGRVDGSRDGARPARIGGRGGGPRGPRHGAGIGEPPRGCADPRS